jgi:hypothetical protein
MLLMYRSRDMSASVADFFQAAPPPELRSLPTIRSEDCLLKRKVHITSGSNSRGLGTLAPGGGGLDQSREMEEHRNTSTQSRVTTTPDFFLRSILVSDAKNLPLRTASPRVIGA